MFDLKSALKTFLNLIIEINHDCNMKNLNVSLNLTSIYDNEIVSLHKNQFDLSD
jgi:hypothetical protein